MIQEELGICFIQMALSIVMLKETCSVTCNVEILRKAVFTYLRSEQFDENMLVFQLYYLIFKSSSCPRLKQIFGPT